MSHIFKGVKILDLTKVFSGPFATRMFADYGAEVIKIEDTVHADDSRQLPPLKNAWSGYYEILNRNKKGISLNLKNDSDLQKLYTLVKEADVFVENLTPSTKFNLKIDYETVRQINPKLIYASLSGRGQQENTKYYDVIAQAESGLMSLCGTRDTPMKIGPAVVDAFSGMTLSFAIASALFHRERTNEGQYLDVAMLGASMNLLESNLIDYSITKSLPLRTGNLDNLISPFGAYKVKDGYVVIAVGNNALWTTLATVLKEHIPINESLYTTNHLRLINSDQLTKDIEEAFKAFSVTDLLSLLTSQQIPCSKVNSMQDVCEDERNYELGFLKKIEHSLLGECVIPGRSISFSSENTLPFSEAPEIGKNDKDYGL